MPADPVAETLELLPTWTAFGPAIWLGLTALVAASLACAGTFVQVHRWRRRVGVTEPHWTERARVAHAARSAIATAVFATLALSGGLATVFRGPFVALGPWVPGVTAGVMCLFAWSIASWRLVVALKPNAPRRRYGEHLRGIVTMTLLFWPTTPALLLMILIVPTEVGPDLWWRWPLGALLVVTATFGYWLGLARVLGFVRPAGERGHAVITRAAELEGAGSIATFEAATPVANAAALPRRRAVVLTDGLLGLLDDDELVAVSRHEIGHFDDQAAHARLRRVALLPLLFLGSIGLVLGELELLGGLAALLVILVLTLTWTRRVAARLRERETGADEHAHEEGPAFARALEKLHAHNLVPAVLANPRSTHPELPDRMIAAGVEPAWERPTPPERPRALAFVSLLVAAGGLIGATILVWNTAKDDAELLLASGFAQQSAVFRYALDERHPPEDAVTLIRAVIELEPDDPIYRAGLARFLAESGSTDEAEVQLETARTLAGDEGMRTGSPAAAWIESAERALAGR